MEKISQETRDWKHYKPTIRALGKDTIVELEAMAPQELRDVVVQANDAMDHAKHELEENASYRAACADKATFETPKKEIEKRQKARIKLALYLLQGKGLL